MNSGMPVPPPARPRSRLILQSVVVLLSVTACCMFAGLIADRYPRHLDVTSTREHRLSQRTLDLLGRLEGDHEIVVTMNSSAAEPRAARRTRDVLDAFERATPRLKTTIIDVASDSGLSQLDTVLARVLERSRADVESQQAALGRVVDSAPEINASLDRLSGLILAANQTVTRPDADALRKFLSDSAAIFRLNAQDLGKAAEDAKNQSRQTIGHSPIPALDAAAQAIRTPIASLYDKLSTFAGSVDAAIKAKDEAVPAETRERLRPVADEVLKLRNRTAGLLNSLDKLPKLPVLTVARVLEKASAAVVIGPPRPAQPGTTPARTLAAVDIETLFPPATPGASGGGAPTLDLRARTEELLGSALASLADPNPPIVVLMHGEPFRFAPGFARFAELSERLRLRGIDLAEWPVALDEQPPALTELNPGNKRPVVYAVFYTTAPTVEAAARLVRLSHTVEALWATGKPILLSATPSTLPAVGQPDPMVEFLAAAGVKVDSGRPLLRQSGAAASPTVWSDTVVSARGGADAHPIGAAIGGLRIRLPWALPLSLTPVEGVTQSPLLTAASDGSTWAESQWMDYAATPAANRAMIRPQDLPKPDSSRDDTKGPWLLAAAIERPVPASSVRQRAVVVGCNTWFRDDIAEAAEMVDNRVRLLNPGNGELFEASVYWLSGQDRFMGASPEAAAVPVIPTDLSPGLLSAIRWLLIAGLPVAILLTGAVWRIVRG